MSTGNRRTNRPRGLNKTQRNQVRKIHNRQQRDHRFYKHALYSVGSTATIASISDIVQGNAIQNRSGVILTPTKLVIKGHVNGADTTNVIRLIIFKWNSITTPPTEGDILEDVTTATGIVDSPYQFSSKKVYTIIYDRRFSTSNTGPDVVLFQKTITRKLSKITYLEGSSSGQGKYYSLVVSDSTTATHPSLSLGTDLQFNA